MRILTIDLGTSATKAALWSEDGPIAMGRAAVDVEHPRPGWVEQDPGDLVDVDARRVRAAPRRRTRRGRRDRLLEPAGHVRPGHDGGRADRPGDRGRGPSRRRMSSRSSARTSRCSPGSSPMPARSRRRSRGCGAHEPDRLSGGQRWIMGPRDLVAFRLTGRGVTDASVASRTGLLALDGAGLDGRRAPAGDRRADDHRRRRPAADGRRPRASAPEHRSWPAPAIARASCSASPRRPPDRWCRGDDRRASPSRSDTCPPPDPGIVVSRGALGGYVMEADLSAAGSALAWLGRLTGRTTRRARATSRRHRRRRRGAARAGVAGRGARAVVGGAHGPHVRRTDARPHGRAPGARARGGRGVRRRPLPRPRGARRGRALARGRWGVDAAVAAGALRRREPAGGRTHARRGGIGRRRDRRRATRSVRSSTPTGWTRSSVREQPFDSDVVAYGDLRMRHEMVARATISAIAGR